MQVSHTRPRDHLINDGRPVSVGDDVANETLRLLSDPPDVRLLKRLGRQRGSLPATVPGSGKAGLQGPDAMSQSAIDIVPVSGRPCDGTGGRKSSYPRSP